MQRENVIALISLPQRGIFFPLTKLEVALRRSQLMLPGEQEAKSMPKKQYLQWKTLIILMLSTLYRHSLLPKPEYLKYDKKFICLKKEIIIPKSGKLNNIFKTSATLNLFLK